MSLNFPVSKNIEMKKETFILHCWYHSHCPFRNAQLQPVQTHSHFSLRSVLICPPSEKTWLKTWPHLGQLFPYCLKRLTTSCVSYITPEWQADTGMSVLCFLWEQHHCFHEAILIQGHFANFNFIKIPPIMIVSTFFLIQCYEPIILSCLTLNSTTVHSGWIQSMFGEWIRE